MKAKVLINDPYGRFKKGDVIEIDAQAKTRFGYIVPFESEEPLFYRGIRHQGLNTLVHFYNHELQMLNTDIDTTDSFALIKTCERP